MPKTIRDIMSKKLVTFTPDTDLYEAMATLVKRAISGAPVVSDAGALVGILSEKDCLKVVMQNAFESLPSPTVGLLMTREVISVEADASIMQAAQMFVQKPIRRLPVLDNGRLVGQVSRRDVVKAVVELGPGYRWRSKKDDVAQTGLMAGNIAHDRVVGPETNRRFA